MDTEIKILKAPIRGNRAQSNEHLPRDPVQVFCRIRPLPSNADLSCVRVESHNTIILTSPENAVNHKLNIQKETQYIFKNVFQESSTQQEVYSMVAKPLIKNLIRGQNGLLFTYGVTGSGKTYTMTGDITNQGIMPRCIDVLFKTISDYQTKKCVFKPDRLNGFEILSDADAMLERQAEMHLRFSKTKRKDSDHEIASQASTEPSPLPGIIDEDNMYAVFVNYIEIYNNSVYDLLEDGGMQRTLQSKIIREDSNHNMYVHGVTEIEIKSVEEAIEVFQTGQKRKRIGHTILNAESSRSHSVFNVRLVQAPTDSQGDNIMQDKTAICISQLSLVDLAGSERTNRTKNSGQRLREAGNINNSLMTLRTCLEYLRENQKSGSHKKIPVRDSKLTHFFKNYFECEGEVRMVVCINPRAEDYDETVQVMKFAEMTQEVQIARPTPVRPDIGLTPGRRKANKIFKIALDNLNDLGFSEAKQLDVDLGLVYSLGTNFPEVELNSPEANTLIKELICYLEKRIHKRAVLQADVQARLNNFRVHLMQLEKENIAIKTENQSLKAVYTQEKQKTHQIENKLIIYESTIDELNRKCKDREEKIKELRTLLSEKEYQISKKKLEEEKQKKKFTSKLAVERDKLKSEFDVRMLHQKTQLEDRMKMQNKKINLFKNIIKEDNIESLPKLRRSTSCENVSENVPPVIPMKPTIHARTVRTLKGVPVANARHRRSKSSEGKWLEHRAPNPVPVGTILQPYLRNRKHITKLTDIRDLTNKKTSNYCLISQQADTDGELETKLYKGEVIPTCAGGAQVIFNDVECLKQKSPISTPQRKRASESQPLSDIQLEEISSRCNLGIEHRSTKKSKV